MSDAEPVLHVAEAVTDHVSFTLALPEEWWTLDLDPRTRHQSIARLVRDRTESLPPGPDTIKFVGALTSRLRRVAKEAEEAGALLCAALTATTDEDILGATLVVTEAAPESPGDLITSLLDDLSGVGGLEQRSVGTVELPLHGIGLRLTGVEETNFEDGADGILSYVHHVVLPVEVSNVALVLTFGTLSVHLVEPLAALFDAIAGSCLVEPGDASRELQVT